MATDSESPRDGRFLEILGYYDPMKEPAVVKIHEDKLQYWIEKGAKLSEGRQGFGETGKRNEIPFPQQPESDISVYSNGR